MGFFDDLLGGLTGQKSMPQQTILSPADIYGGANSLLAGPIAQGTIGYNNALVTPFTQNQLTAEQMISPGAFDLRKSSLAGLQNDLNLGYSIPKDLQDQLTTQFLQANGMSGLGASQAGDIYGRRSLLSAGLDLGRQRLQDALAGSQFRSYYQPQLPYGQTPGIQAAQAIQGEQAAKDEYANLQEDLRQQNFAKKINFAGKLIGTGVGAAFGGPAGAMMGGNIGGSLYQGGGVAGQPSGAGQPAGGGGFGSLLSGLFGGGGGIGGPQYGIGAGRQYTMGPNQPIQTSVKAAAYEGAF